MSSQPVNPGNKPASLGLGDVNVNDLGSAVSKTGASEQVVAIFEIAAGVVLIITTAITGVGVLVGVGVIAVGLLGLFEKTSDLESNVKKLVADFNIFFAELQAEADIELMRSVGDKIANARTALLTLRTSPDNPNLKDPNGAVLFTSALEVEALGDISFYLRPFFPAAAYSDPWSGPIPPPAFPHSTSSSIVFEYRLTLPAFLEAIAIRLTILTALIPNFRLSQQAELRDNMANPLESLYVRIRDGIVPLRNPTVQEILSTKVFDVNDGRVLRIEPSAWDKTGRPYGAVERYSAVSVVDNYRADRFLPNPQNAFLVSSETLFGERDNPNPPPLPGPQFPSQEALAPFLLEYAIGILARSKAVYNVVGLPKLKAAVNLLKDLAGEPRLETRPDGGWSIREIDNTVATILFNRPSTAEGPNAPIKVGRIVSLLQSTLIGLPVQKVSLRQILDKIALQN
jgi:hypothetical protein